MYMIAFVFPGQGSQYVGMGEDLFDAFPEARRTFEEASDVLGFDLTRLCFGGDPGELALTSNAQPAILTHSVAALRALKAHTVLGASYMAGHSLGEFTALVATGALGFGDAVRVVRMRGEFMQQAVPPGVGAMAAVLGTLDSSIYEICAEGCHESSFVSPANFNAPGQVVISGHKEAVERAGEIAKSRGARRVVHLDVSAPFHCKLMNSAAERLSEVLYEVEVGALDVPVVTNVEAEPNTDSSRVKHLLYEQVSNPVMWDRSVVKMSQLGVDDFVEIGPGGVLEGLIKRTVKGSRVTGVEKAEHIEGIKRNGLQR
ncbi:MAG: ACP S-malonyltransferase [Candidatus Dadabacteria bacterium]|nr:ACP S-malonyltransferase [Candidatus Dadabacteria bacterium]